MSPTEAEQIRNNLADRALTMGAESFAGSLSFEEECAITYTGGDVHTFWLRAGVRTPRIPFPTGNGLFWYTPITPQPDTDELAKSARLILRHDRRDGPRLFVAPAGDLQAGWVVGVGD